MIKIGIIGGAGYTAGELLRLLVFHPQAEIVFVHSASNPGRPVTEVHSGLTGDCDLRFSSDYNLNDIDCLFLCSGHGASSLFWQENERPDGLRVIDLAQDFRDESNGYVYGLTELNAERIRTTSSVANPGCFATAIQLALMPLAKAGILPTRVSLTGITGSTGAGVKPGATTHFSWRSGNLSVYKVFTHQHLAEIDRTLHSLQPRWSGDIDFVPVRGDFPRGIFVMATMPTSLTPEQNNRIYADCYSTSPFTHFVEAGDLDLKQVVNTNKALVTLKQEGNKLLVVSAIDNLLKGASGQAVENMNLMFGLDQTIGLNLKPLAF